MTAIAQSIMPATDTNTPKGEVAKPDASFNQANATGKSTSTKTMKLSSKRSGKMKTTKPKTTSAM